MEKKSRLALLDSPKGVQSGPCDAFAWPIITDEDRQAAMDVLNRGAWAERVSM